MQSKNLVAMLAVNILIMNINIWQLQEKRIKKGVSETAVMNHLWFFMNLHKEWMQEWDFC